MARQLNQILTRASSVSTLFIGDSDCWLGILCAMRAWIKNDEYQRSQQLRPPATTPAIFCNFSLISWLVLFTFLTHPSLSSLSIFCNIGHKHSCCMTFNPPCCIVYYCHVSVRHWKIQWWEKLAPSSSPSLLVRARMSQFITVSVDESMNLPHIGPCHLSSTPPMSSI